MIPTKKLSAQDTLPLTCSRTGTCCHGKQVFLNPWELLCFAKEKKVTAREFRDRYCEFGGVRLKFDGNKGWKDQNACSQYVDGFGCSVHLGRPLACRLYPLGRQIQSGTVHYMFQGEAFPCLEGCPEVEQLPHLSVEEYLGGQQTEKFEKAQDEYLNITEGLADIAFMLLLDTGLSESGDKATLPLWRKLGNEEPGLLAKRIGPEWLDLLMLPEIDGNSDDPVFFAQKHLELLQAKAQEKYGSLQANQELHAASVEIMGVALHLARGIGADPSELAGHWADVAKQHGAEE